MILSLAVGGATIGGVTVLKWIARYWPYVLIAIAVVGIAYRVWVGSF